MRTSQPDGYGSPSRRRGDSRHAGTTKRDNEFNEDEAEGSGLGLELPGEWGRGATPEPAGRRSVGTSHQCGKWACFSPWGSSWLRVTEWKGK